MTAERRRDRAGFAADSRQNRIEAAASPRAKSLQIRSPIAADLQPNRSRFATNPQPIRGGVRSRFAADLQPIRSRFAAAIAGSSRPIRIGIATKWRSGIAKPMQPKAPRARVLRSLSRVVSGVVPPRAGIMSALFPAVFLPLLTTLFFRHL
ncbi:hypothetical protein [Paraburkholderia sp. J41]|uniref:hypothetical protein n=1 Tax=Paraburkholderia sp. J41 TaxID=2805433 RepID=UPI002AC3177E|nr:hypothetical protein [Paraburkholderia sp. J41]